MRFTRDGLLLPVTKTFIGLGSTRPQRNERPTNPIYEPVVFNFSVNGTRSTLFPSSSLTTSFVLIFVDPKSGRQAFGSVQSHDVIVDPSCDNTSDAKLASFSKKTLSVQAWNQSRSKTNAFEYFNKNLEAEKSHPQFKLDLGFTGSRDGHTRSFYNLQLNPYRISRIGFLGSYDWDRAYFEAGLDTNADTDRIEIGSRVKADWIWNRKSKRTSAPVTLGRKSQQLFTGLNFESKAFFLTDHKIRTFGLGVTNSVKLPLNLIRDNQTILQVTPFVGYTWGFRFRNTGETELVKLEELDNWTSRFGIGGSWNLIPFHYKGKPIISMQGEYINRIFSFR